MAHSSSPYLRACPEFCIDFVADEVVSFVESNYRIRPERSHRGLGGWSYGGNFVVQLASLHAELFRAVATYAGDDPACVPRLTAQYNAWRNPLDFWLWYGTSDPILDRTADILEWLESEQLPHEFFTDNGDHYGLHQPLVRSFLFFSEIFAEGDGRYT